MTLRKISSEEAAQLNPSPVGKSHPVRAYIAQLAAGEILHIEKSDFLWKGKTPKIFTKELEQKRKGKFEVQNCAGGGWLVKRVK